MFGRVTPQVVAELRAAVGEAHVLTKELERFSHDETEDLEYPPEVAVLPSTTDEVVAILKVASAHRIPVTPQSARSGLSGGALCVHGGIALAMERMDRIVDIDTANLFAVAEPGVITGVLQEEVEKRGLFYPPDPASRSYSTIGGNVAHNAGGPRALKYGVTKDWITGLEAVLADGRVVRTGGKLLKNVAGYNLTHLLVGSEGTLAVVTRIWVKLIPKPAHAKTILAPFPDVVSAAQAVTDIFRERILPCACEYMERAAVEAVEERKGMRFPVSGGEAVLLVEVDGPDEALLERDLERIAELFMARGAPDVVMATDAESRRKIWDLRRSVGEAVKSISPYKEEDTVVPRAKLPELVETVREVMRKHGLTAISYGHVGDGNLHVNILKRELTNEQWGRAVEPAVRELFRRTVAMGGQITGEHGVGFVQRNYLDIAYPRHQIELLREVKRVFDPQGILNPSKVLPDDR